MSAVEWLDVNGGFVLVMDVLELKTIHILVASPGVMVTYAGILTSGAVISEPLWLTKGS